MTPTTSTWPRCTATFAIKTPYGNFLHGSAKKENNLELVAQYQFDFGMHPSIGYLRSRINGDQDDKSYGIKNTSRWRSYNFNKNMLTFIDYRINPLSENDFTRAKQISTDNIVALGMTYSNESTTTKYRVRETGRAVTTARPSV